MQKSPTVTTNAEEARDSPNSPSMAVSGPPSLNQLLRRRARGLTFCPQTSESGLTRRRRRKKKKGVRKQELLQEMGSWDSHGGSGFRLEDHEKRRRDSSGEGMDMAYPLEIKYTGPGLSNPPLSFPLSL